MSVKRAQNSIWLKEKTRAFELEKKLLPIHGKGIHFTYIFLICYFQIKLTSKDLITISTTTKEMCNICRRTLYTRRSKLILYWFYKYMNKIILKLVEIKNKTNGILKGSKLDQQEMEKKCAELDENEVIELQQKLVMLQQNDSTKDLNADSATQIASPLIIAETATVSNLRVDQQSTSSVDHFNVEFQLPQDIGPNDYYDTDCLNEEQNDDDGSNGYPPQYILIGI